MRVASRSVSRFVGVAREAFRRRLGFGVVATELERVGLTVFSSQGSVCRAERAIAEGNSCSVDRDFAGVAYAADFEHVSAARCRRVLDATRATRPARSCLRGYVSVIIPLCISRACRRKSAGVNRAFVNAYRRAVRERAEHVVRRFEDNFVATAAEHALRQRRAVFQAGDCQLVAANFRLPLVRIAVFSIAFSRASECDFGAVLLERNIRSQRIIDCQRVAVGAGERDCRVVGSERAALNFNALFADDDVIAQLSRVANAADCERRRGFGGREGVALAATREVSGRVSGSVFAAREVFGYLRAVGVAVERHGELISIVAAECNRVSCSRRHVKRTFGYRDSFVANRYAVRIGYAGEGELLAADLLGVSDARICLRVEVARASRLIAKRAVCKRLALVNRRASLGNVAIQRDGEFILAGDCDRILVESCRFEFKRRGVAVSDNDVVAECRCRIQVGDCERLCGGFRREGQLVVRNGAVSFVDVRSVGAIRQSRRRLNSLLLLAAEVVSKGEGRGDSARFERDCRRRRQAANHRVGNFDCVARRCVARNCKAFRRSYAFQAEQVFRRGRSLVLNSVAVDRVALCAVVCGLVGRAFPFSVFLRGCSVAAASDVDCVGLAVLRSYGDITIAECAVCELNRRAVKRDLARVFYAVAAEFEQFIAAACRSVFNGRLIVVECVAFSDNCRLVGVAFKACRCRRCRSTYVAGESERVGVILVKGEGDIATTEVALLQRDYIAATNRNARGVRNAIKCELVDSLNSQRVGDLLLGVESEAFGVARGLVSRRAASKASRRRRGCNHIRTQSQVVTRIIERDFGVVANGILRQRDSRALEHVVAELRAIYAGKREHVGSINSCRVLDGCPSTVECVACSIALRLVARARAVEASRRN